MAHQGSKFWNIKERITKTIPMPYQVVLTEMGHEGSPQTKKALLNHIPQKI
jgi:hypothetical protein